MEVVLSIIGLLVFVYLCTGAILLVQDSETRHSIRKELKSKYPDLTRDQIRVLSYIKLKEMLEKQNEK